MLGKGVKNGIFRFRAKEKTANDMAKPTVPGSKHRHVYIPARALPTGRARGGARSRGEHERRDA